MNIMPSFFRKYRFLLPLLILIYIMTLSLGAGMMIMDDNGQTSYCPLMDSGTFCQMNMFEHLAIFQSMFMGISANAFRILAVFITLTVLIFFNNGLKETERHKLRKILKTSRPGLNIYNKLLQALSNGVLQPKLYA